MSLSVASYTGGRRARSSSLRLLWMVVCPLAYCSATLIVTLNTAGSPHRLASAPPWRLNTAKACSALPWCPPAAEHCEGVRCAPVGAPRLCLAPWSTMHSRQHKVKVVNSDGMHCTVYMAGLCRHLSDGCQTLRLRWLRGSVPISSSPIASIPMEASISPRRLVPRFPLFLPLPLPLPFG